MFGFLPSPLKGVIATLILICNTLFWCVFIYFFALLKFCIPIRSFQAWCSKIMVAIGQNWISGNSFEIRLMHPVQWVVQGLDGLDKNKSYLVYANHQSWVDIVALQKIFNRRIPLLRFFLKRQLAYVPLLGLAWWALDFPFMQRYSKEYLARNPQMRGRDLETTRRACERFQGTPISILNFLEGTRFSEEKRAQTKSIYKNLLMPKTGGIAFVLQTMGSQFDAILDVTLVYPDGVPTLWGLLSGKLDRVVANVRRIEIPKSLLAGNYLEQDEFRERMQSWIKEAWTEKDQLITELKNTYPRLTPT